MIKNLAAILFFAQTVSMTAMGRSGHIEHMRPLDPDLLTTNEDEPKPYVNQLFLRIHTRDDDLRGGNDNVHVRVRFRDGGSIVAWNLNEGRNWGDYTVNYATISLGRTIEPRDLESLTLITNATGGTSGDNWNMSYINIDAGGISETLHLTERGFFRFTGDSPTLFIKL